MRVTNARQKPCTLECKIQQIIVIDAFLSIFPTLSSFINRLSTSNKRMDCCPRRYVNDSTQYVPWTTWTMQRKSSRQGALPWILPTPPHLSTTLSHPRTPSEEVFRTCVRPDCRVYADHLRAVNRGVDNRCSRTRQSKTSVSPSSPIDRSRSRSLADLPDLADASS